MGIQNMDHLTIKIMIVQIGKNLFIKYIKYQISRGPIMLKENSHQSESSVSRVSRDVKLGHSSFKINEVWNIP